MSPRHVFKPLTMEAMAKVQAKLVSLVPGAEVIRSTDPRRVVIVEALNASHAATGRGWDREHAKAHVSMAVPALSGALTLPASLLGVPVLGGLATQLTRGFDHPLVSPSPSAEGDPVELFDVLTHEFGHLLQVEKGGLLWCLKYLLHVEHAVLAAETPCYACEAAAETWFRHRDPQVVIQARAEAMRAYGATDAFVGDALRILRSHVIALNGGLCPPTRTLIEAVKVLRAEGYDELPKLPALAVA